MPKIVVMGGGWCGLTTALMLHRGGHDVTVLEKDVAGPSGDPWTDWDRAGVAQFRQPHILMPRGHAILAQELPDAASALRAAGGVEYSFLDPLAALIPPERQTEED